MIAHRLNTIRNADTIMVIDDGTVMEKGSHDALIRERGRYYNLFNQQSHHVKRALE